MSSSKLLFWAKLSALYCAVIIVFSLPLLLNGGNDTTSASATPQVNTSKTRELQSEEAQVGAPTSLVIQDLSIQAAIEEGAFVPSQRTWQTTPNAVGWIRHASEYKNGTLDSDTILYGHNSELLLKNTESIRPGTKLLIKTTNNYYLTYEFKGYMIVKPEDASVLRTVKPSTLTLITCTGQNDSLRKLMEFTFTEIRHEY